MSSKPRPIFMSDSDFQSMREEGAFYVDKTLVVKDFFECPDQYFLLTRPRRFGKTLNLSTIRYFVEKTEPSRAHLYKGLQITEYPEIMRHQGKYPVIYFTLKDVKPEDFESLIEQMRLILMEVCQQVRNTLVKYSFEEEDQILWDQLRTRTADQAVLAKSLAFLTRWLHEATGEKVILLIDEYDTPIQSSYLANDYTEVIKFFRTFLSAGLKDNPHLKRAMLTGILRISKESIFSGLNNFGIYTILSQHFSSRFGFTEEEVIQILKDLELTEQLEGIRNWYNGYSFGNQPVIYNPWSVTKFLRSPEEGLKPYWINSSGDDLIKELITEGSSEIHAGVEDLLRGEAVVSSLEEYTSFRDLQSSDSQIWSLFAFSGYLKPLVKEKIQQGDETFYPLRIPNQEVRTYFEQILKHWLNSQVNTKDLNPLQQALIEGDYEIFEERLQYFVESVLSFHDTAGNEPERVYHAFVLGLLLQLQSEYIIRSNRESGLGRYDIVMIPRDSLKKGFIFEFKRLNPQRSESPEETLGKALQQIQKKNYAAELIEHGITQIDALAIVVHQKRVWMKTEVLAGVPTAV